MRCLWHLASSLHHGQAGSVIYRYQLLCSHRGTEGVYRVVGVARLDAELGENPDAVSEFQRLIEHVLALHVPLGDGVDVVILQLA